MEHFDTTSNFISDHVNSSGYTAGDVIKTYGYSSLGGVGGSRWKATGNIIAASQDPLALNDIKLSDASGNEFELMVEESGIIDLNVLGGTSASYINIATSAGLTYSQGLTSDVSNDIVNQETVDTMINTAGVSVGEAHRTAEFSTGNGGGGTYDAVLTSSVTPNGRDIIQGVADTSISFDLRITDFVNPRQLGATGDGVTDDTGAWNAWVALSGSKYLPIGSYLVSGVVKEIETPTFVNTVNNNHGAGFQALESIVNGENNTAFGHSAMRVTDGALPLGSNNVAVGADALASNIEGYRSVAVGYQSCFSNIGDLVFGNSLVGVGYQTLFNNDEGKDNTAIGYLSMFFNEGGGGNTAVGYRSLYSNTGTTDGSPAYAAIDGSFNTCIGYEAMLDNTLGNSGTALGWRSMFSNTTGTRNTAAGQESLRDNTTGTDNVAFGYQAMMGCVNGNDNVAIGYEALHDSTGPDKNVAIGRESMAVATSAVENVGVGHQSLTALTGGDQCAAVGYRALSRLTTGSNCSALGYQALEFTIAGGSLLSFTNSTGIGNGSRVSGSDQVQLGDASTTTYAYGAVQDRSDERDKLDIQSLTDAHIAFFMDIEWKQFRMNYREKYTEIAEDGTLTQLNNDGSKAGVRFHIGAIAQQVEAAMKKHGVDFAGLQHHAVKGGEDVYTIGYQEFIGLQGEIIQRQQKSIDTILKRLDSAGI